MKGGEIMAKSQDKIMCQNRFKDNTNIKDSFNKIWITLINQLERNGMSDLQAVRGDV